MNIASIRPSLVALATACVLGGVPATVRAEIEKIATPSDSGLRLTWWPKLAAPPGWHHDREASQSVTCNVFVPDGSTFSDADVVMYARALYKPRMALAKSLDEIVADDRRDFLARDPDLAVSALPELTTADGRKLRSNAFFPKAKGNWERVAYGEEGDFFLLFTISARSLSGYRERQSDYEKLVRGYRSSPPAEIGGIGDASRSWYRGARGRDRSASFASDRGRRSRRPIERSEVTTLGATRTVTR